MNIPVKPNFDTVCTWDNLGQLWEMRGDFTKAREARVKESLDMMICSYFNVSVRRLIWKIANTP